MTSAGLGHPGFAIQNEWYWKLTEHATTLGATAAVRDFLAPLARLAAGRFEIDELAVDDDDRGVRLRVAQVPFAIRLANGSDRVAINHLVDDVNRALLQAELGQAFALVVPRRYELRGVLLTDAALAALTGDPMLLVPSMRPSWRSP